MEIVLDGRMDGVEAAEQILSSFRIPVVYLTPVSNDEVFGRVARSAPYGYLTKPCQIRDLSSAIEIALARRRVEEALFESERRYRAIFDNVSDAILVSEVCGGTAGPFVGANEAVLHRLGYEREELLKYVVQALEGRQRGVRDDPCRGGRAQTPGKRECAPVRFEREGARPLYLPRMYPLNRGGYPLPRALAYGPG